ncbi:hypothetical protein [Nocardiopsis sp. CC223A]|uniref:TPR repeat region-containing protein n=1 Tax=Nocardiopsis sp. CC223A TaxID=3044051 RepID=UPI002795C1D1|nr:hypothetical protein [Nocardiopsis sp. CC223A]
MSSPTFRKSDWVIDADPDGLSSSQAVFQSAGTMLTGSGNNIFDRVSSGAEEFTDLISEDIKSCASFDLENWGKAFFSCIYGDSVVETWREAVKKYNSTIDGLEGEWSEAVGNEFGVDVEPLSGDPDKRADDLVDLGIARQGKYSELKLQAETARGELEEVAERVNTMLEDGPSSEDNIEYLVRSGLLGWAPYAIFGYGQPVPIELDWGSGEEWADKFSEAVNSGGEIPPLLLRTLDYLNDVASRKLANGESLSPEELDFLEAFYGGLEGEFQAPMGGDLQGEDLGVLALPQVLGDRADLSEQERELILGTLADNLIFLSNESIGGNFEYLPGSVQAAALGPNAMGDDHREGEWGSNFIRLGVLFDHASGDSEAGTTFSANLTSTTGYALLSNLDTTELWLGSTLFDKSQDYYLDAVLDVSTRNKDANYSLLVGDFDSPYFGSEDSVLLEDVLEGLFTHDWSDGDIEGRPAVTGLTDWIYQDAVDLEGNESERTRAAEAAVGLIETLANEEMYNRLTGLDFFGEDGSKVENATFTALNPDIADSLVNIYAAYIDSFAGQAGMDGEAIEFSWERGSGDPVWNDSSGTFEMSPGDRLVFLEYLLGEEDSAVGVVSALETYHQGHLDRMTTTGETENTGASAARLNALVDAAFHNEAIRMGLDEEGARNNKERIYSSLKGVGSAALGEIPVVGIVLSGAFDYSAESAKQDLIERVSASIDSQNPSGGAHKSSMWVDVNSRLHVLDAFLDNNGGDLPYFDPGLRVDGRGPIEILSDAGIIVESEAGFTVVSDADEWSVNSADQDVSQALKFVLQEAPVDWIPGIGDTGGQLADSFSEAFSDSQTDYSGLKFEKEDMKDGYWADLG